MDYSAGKSVRREFARTAQVIHSHADVCSIRITEKSTWYRDRTCDLLGVNETSLPLDQSGIKRWQYTWDKKTLMTHNLLIIGPGGGLLHFWPRAVDVGDDPSNLNEHRGNESWSSHHSARRVSPRGTRRAEWMSATELLGAAWLLLVVVVVLQPTSTTSRIAGFSWPGGQ